MTDLSRVATVLREQARGRRDALEDEWGESPTLPPKSVGPAPVTPSSAREFTDETYPWRADCVVRHGDRVLGVRSGDSWTLPGTTGRRGDDPVRTAVKAVREHTGVECEVTGVAYTQLLEFETETETLPVLRVVFSALPTSDPDQHRSDADWRTTASLVDGEERDLLENSE